MPFLKLSNLERFELSKNRFYIDIDDRYRNLTIKIDLETCVFYVYLYVSNLRVLLSYFISITTLKWQSYSDGKHNSECQTLEVEKGNGYERIIW